MRFLQLKGYDEMLNTINLIGSAIIAAPAMLLFFLSTKDIAESVAGSIFVFAIALFVLDYLRNHFRSIRRKKELFFKNY